MLIPSALEGSIRGNYSCIETIMNLCQPLYQDNVDDDDDDDNKDDYDNNNNGDNNDNEDVDYSKLALTFY